MTRDDSLSVVHSPQRGGPASAHLSMERVSENVLQDFEAVTRAEDDADAAYHRLRRTGPRRAGSGLPYPGLSESFP